MIRACDFCGNEFLTEADPYIVIPTKDHALSCGCKVHNFYHHKKILSDMKSVADNRIEDAKGEIERLKRETNYYKSIALSMFKDITTIIDGGYGDHVWTRRKLKGIYTEYEDSIKKIREELNNETIKED